MTGLFAYLAELLQTVGNAVRWLGAQLLSMLTGLWRAALVVLDQVLAWVLQLVEWGVLGVVEVAMYLVEAAVQILPGMPAKPNAVGTLQDALAVANRYLPVQEALVLGLLWGAIYAGVWAYKGAKFIRGGG